MRRSLILLSSIVALAIGGSSFALAGSSAATSRGASARIVCPPSARSGGSCCDPRVPPAGTSRDAVVCCSSCSGRLTINAEPDPATAGEQVRVSGRLFGLHPAGSRIVLWHRLPGWRRFHPVTRTTTNTTGRYLIVRDPGIVETNRAWYVVSGRVRSRMVQERVQAILTLNASGTTAAPGDRVILSGQVTPAHRGERVLLEQRFGSQWVTIARPRLDRRSDFRATRGFLSEGVAPVRAVLPGDPRNIRSYSPVVSIAVNAIHKIKHVVIIMQENRSFDQYFGSA